MDTLDMSKPSSTPDKQVSDAATEFRLLDKLPTELQCKVIEYAYEDALAIHRVTSTKTEPDGAPYITLACDEFAGDGSKGPLEFSRTPWGLYLVNELFCR